MSPLADMGAGLGFVRAAPAWSVGSVHLRGNLPVGLPAELGDAVPASAGPTKDTPCSFAGSAAVMGIGIAAAALCRHASRRGRGVCAIHDMPRVCRFAIGQSRLSDGGIMGSSLDQAIEAKAEEEMIKVNLPIKGAPEGIKQIRCVYPAGLARYGEEYSRKEGSTDNVYMLTPKDAPYVLLGLHPGPVANNFLQVLGDDVDRLGHIVIMYFDNNKGDTIEAIVNARSPGLPPLQVYCSNPVKVALTKGLSADVLEKISLNVIKKSTKLEVTPGRVLQFVLSPTPKLPEACVCFDPATGTLFTGKFFSAHVALDKSKAPFDKKGRSGWEEFSYDWYHLFDSYFFTSRAQAAVRRIFGLCEALEGPDVQILAPLHGPVVREQCWKLMAKYEAWTEAKLRKEDRRDTEVLVMYASAYGHTKTLAESVEKGLKTSGVRVTSVNLEHTPIREVVKALDRCNGFCMGSPTLGGEMPSQVKEALGAVLHAGGSATVKKPCGLFGSYGWSGEAVDEMQFRLTDGGFPFAFEPIKVKFRPTQEALELCEEAGVKMAQKLQQMIREAKKRRVRKIESVTKSGAFRDAFGKMRTSQCVLAMKDANGSDVLIPTSWVNQAGFDPPSLTVSVPKGLLDVILDLRPESIRKIIEKKYQTSTGNLSTEQLEDMLKEMGMVNNMEMAFQILDKDGDGQISIDEVQEAMTDNSGPLYAAALEHLRSISMEAAFSEADSGGGIRFTLNTVPDTVELPSVKGMSPHKKAKPANGCKVVAEAHAYTECVAMKLMNAGDHCIILAKIEGGKVLQDSVLTQMVTVDKELETFGSSLESLKVDKVASESEKEAVAA